MNVVSFLLSAVMVLGFTMKRMLWWCSFNWSFDYFYYFRNRCCSLWGWGYSKFSLIVWLNDFSIV